VQLGEHNQHHIQVCPVFGRAIKAHDESSSSLPRWSGYVVSPT
jgi:hypothetical protein